MAFLDHEGGADFPYPRDVVFDALVAVIPSVPGMKVHHADRLSGRIMAKAGVSLMSWGENIPIVVSETTHGHARVSITSTPKTGVLFGGAFDGGKNRENIERLLTALSGLLKKTSPTIAPASTREGRGEPADRIIKLHELVDKGLISPAEFEKRKGEILSEV